MSQYHLTRGFCIAFVLFSQLLQVQAAPNNEIEELLRVLERKQTLYEGEQNWSMIGTLAKLGHAYAQLENWPHSKHYYMQSMEMEVRTVRKQFPDFEMSQIYEAEERDAESFCREREEHYHGRKGIYESLHRWEELG
jgi:hypothetical protein